MRCIIDYEILITQVKSPQCLEIWKGKRIIRSQKQYMQSRLIVMNRWCVQRVSVRIVINNFLYFAAQWVWALSAWLITYCHLLLYLLVHYHILLDEDYHIRILFFDVLISALYLEFPLPFRLCEICFSIPCLLFEYQYRL